MLLECLSTWLTNELYRPDASAMAKKKIWAELQQLQRCCANLLVVSNDVFADGVVYDREIMVYLEGLGWLHQQLAQEADLVIEVVVGLPVVQKGNCRELAAQYVDCFSTYSRLPVPQVVWSNAI